MIIYIVSFTQKGDSLNTKIKNALSHHEVHSFLRRDTDNISAWTKTAFTKADAVIFIGAAGIAVRSIAPYLKSKITDPAVVVCDELGRYAIPVLSGHIGGANRLADELSALLGCTAVITTATDINSTWAVDNWCVQRGYLIKNPECIKHISAALLDGHSVGLVSDVNIGEELPKSILRDNTAAENGIVVSPFSKKPYKNTLNVVPKCLCIGVGSRKDVSENTLVDIFKKILWEHNLYKQSVLKIATIDIKKNEKSIKRLCEYTGAELVCYTAAELNEAKGDFEKSDFVLGETGTDNVCERAAVLAANGGRLAVKKTKGTGVTIAAAICAEV